MSDLREYSYKVKGIKDLEDLKIDNIKNELSSVSGVIAFNVDKETETVDYALDQWSSDYEAFSKLSEICESHCLELVYDEEEVIESEVEEEIVIAEEDKFEEEKKIIKNKLTKSDTIEKIILVALSLGFLITGLLLNKYPNAQPWILMVGFTLASYEILYDVVVKATEKLYVIEEIITFLGALILTYLGYTAGATVIMLLYSGLSFSVAFAKHKIAVKKEELTAKIEALEDECLREKLTKELSFIETNENAYEVKLNSFNRTRLIVNLSFVALAVLAVFIPPLFTIKTYWSVLTKTWLYLGASILILSGFGETLFSLTHTELLAILNAKDNYVTINSLKKFLNLAEKDTVVFDKTGVLVSDTAVEGVVGDGKTLLYALSAVQSFDNHIANAVKTYAKDLSSLDAKDVKVSANMGVSYKVDGDLILVGNKRYLKDNSIACEDVKDGKSHLFVCKNGVVIGYLILTSEVYADSFGAVAEIKNDIYLKTELLSADEGEVVTNLKKSLQIEKAISGASAKFKAEKINGQNAIYVCNEKNDGQTLSMVEDSIVFGCSGNVCITNNSIRKVPFIIKLAKRTAKTLKFNKSFAFSIKFVLIALSIVLRAITTINFIWWLFAFDVLARAITVIRAILNSSEPA